MSILPTSLGGSFAGAPLAQQKGSEVERASHDTVAQARQSKSDALATDAAGVAATDGDDTQPHERDADGRRLWEAPADNKPEATADAPPAAPSQSRDPTGTSGSQLDLLG